MVFERNKSCVITFILIFSLQLIVFFNWSNSPWMQRHSPPLQSLGTSHLSFRRPPQSPPLFLKNESLVIPEIQRQIEINTRLRDAIAETVTPENATFGNSVLEFAQQHNELVHKTQWVELCAAALPLYKKCSEATALLAQHKRDYYLNERVFKIVDAVLKMNESLDAESQRLLEKEHGTFLRSGLGIPPGPNRDRFNANQRRQSEIRIEFEERYNRDHGVWFTAQQLEGMPLEQLPQGHGENEGKLRLPLTDPYFLTALSHVRQLEVRRHIYIANENKDDQNVPLVKEMFALRDEAARLLEYGNHAWFKLAESMVKEPKTVSQLLEVLIQAFGKHGREEIARLKLYKEVDGELDDGICLWDRYYYEQALQQTFGINETQCFEYFPLSHVLPRMLETLGHMFGTTFIAITDVQRDLFSQIGAGNDIIWHDDVMMYAVWDDDIEGNEFLGYLYFDLYPRHHKYGYASNVNIQPGFLHADGTRSYPSTAILTNFERPTSQRPSLLKPYELETLTHELGHAIHDFVSRTRFARFHGTNTAQDFVETPSQVLEFWTRNPVVLKHLSLHHLYLSKGHSSSDRDLPLKTFPDELVQCIQPLTALSMLRQLALAKFDMVVHSPEDPQDILHMPISETYNKIQKETIGMNGMETYGYNLNYTHGETSDDHLMDGYDVAYYGYVLSLIIALDVLDSGFKADLMNSTEGRRWRHIVLERGGSQDEMQTIRDYLGRWPSINPFYSVHGIVWNETQNSSFFSSLDS